MVGIAVSEGRAESLLDVVRDVVGNCVLDDDGNWWATFRLRGHSYHRKSKDHKWEIFDAMETALQSVPTRVKILSLIRNFGGETYVDGLRAINPEGERWLWHCNLVQAGLESRVPYYREFYLCVRLNESPGDLVGAAQHAVGILRAMARSFLGSPLRFTADEVTRAWEMSRQIEQRFGDKLIVGPCSVEDIQYLVARGPYRAVGEPPILEGWTPRRFVREDGRGVTFYEPYAQDLLNLHGEIGWVAENGHLEFRHGGGLTSYQRFLAVKSMPTNDLAFPGAEWALLDLPVDLVLDFDVIPAPQAERQRKDKSQKAREQGRHAAGADADLDIGLTEAEVASRRLEALHAEGKPRLDVHATLAVAAPSLPELDTLEGYLRDFYTNSGLKIGLSLPKHTQVQCFADFLPVGPRRNGDYRQPMSSFALSGGMPVGTATLGDGRGFYLGWPLAQPDDVVAFDPRLPMKSDVGGAAAVWGDPGGGKSMLVQGMVYQFTLAGFENLIVDPKGDSDKFRYIEELDGAIRWIRVEAGSPTVLPILSIFGMGSDKAIADTEALLTSFLLQTMNAVDQVDYARAIRFGVQDFLKDDALRRQGIPGLRDQLLRNGQTDRYGGSAQDFSRQAARELDYFMQNSLGRIALCSERDGETLFDDGTAAPLTIIQTNGLDLVDREDLEQMTEKQRVSQALHDVVAAAAMRMASRHRYADVKPFKALVFDEAWRFLGNPGGKGLLRYLIREGRSQNIAPYVCSQAVADFQDLLGLMPIRFMGRNRQDTDDIVRGLKVCGVDPSPYNVKRIKEFKAGNFLFHDAFGNVGEMKYDVTPKSLITRLGSRPKGEEEAGRPAASAQSPAAPTRAELREPSVAR